MNVFLYKVTITAGGVLIENDKEHQFGVTVRRGADMKKLRRILQFTETVAEYLYDPEDFDAKREAAAAGERVRSLR